MLPDAYGFGYYQAGNVLLGKRPTGAPAQLSLPDLVGRVDSEALLVHARRATIGKAKDENTHPFRFRRWLFAHDGTIEGFEQVKPKLLAGLPDFLRRHIGGDTDSEHAFMWFAEAAQGRRGRLDDLDLDAAGRRARARAHGPADRGLEPRRRRAEAVRASASSRRTGARWSRRAAAVRCTTPCSRGSCPARSTSSAPETPESDPRVRPHRRVKAVCFASRLLSPNGFIEVPEGSVVSVSRTLQVSVAPIDNA